MNVFSKARNKSKQRLVKEALLNGESITPLDALKRFGTFRLSAIIFNLRKEGLKIDMQMVKNRLNEESNGYASYKLINNENSTEN